MKLGTAGMNGGHRAAAAVGGRGPRGVPLDTRSPLAGLVESWETFGSPGEAR
jgi:hypothetical protein